MLPERHEKEAAGIVAITGHQGRVDSKQTKHGRTRRGVDRPRQSRSESLYRVEVT